MKDMFGWDGVGYAYWCVGEPDDFTDDGDSMKLYEVFLIYPVGDVLTVWNRVDVFARNEEEAKIKSGTYRTIGDDWDVDRMTIICRVVGTVNTGE